MAADNIALPVIDFSELQGNPQQRAALLEKLGKAARDIGFFYLTGHGISSELLTHVQHISRRFFALPEADKLSVKMANSPISVATIVRAWK